VKKTDESKTGAGRTSGRAWDDIDEGITIMDEALKIIDTNHINHINRTECSRRGSPSSKVCKANCMDIRQPSLKWEEESLWI